jgi:hypothetical protein
MTGMPQPAYRPPAPRPLVLCHFTRVDVEVEPQGRLIKQVARPSLHPVAPCSGRQGRGCTVMFGSRWVQLRLAQAMRYGHCSTQSRPDTSHRQVWSLLTNKTARPTNTTAALCDLAGAVAGSGGGMRVLVPVSGQRRPHLQGGGVAGAPWTGAVPREGGGRPERAGRVVAAGRRRRRELSLLLGCGPAAAGRRGAGQSRMTAEGYRERGAGKCRPGCGICGLRDHSGQPRRPAAAHFSLAACARPVTAAAASSGFLRVMPGLRGGPRPSRARRPRLPPSGRDVAYPGEPRLGTSGGRP